MRRQAWRCAPAVAPCHRYVLVAVCPDVPYQRSLWLLQGASEVEENLGWAWGHKETLCDWGCGGRGLLFRDKEKPPSPGLCGPPGPAYGQEASMPQHQEGTQRAFSFSSKVWRAGPWTSPQSSAYSPCRVRPQGWGQFLPREEPASLLPVGTSVLEACWPCSMFPSGRLTEVCLFPWRSLLPCGWYPAVPGHPLDQVHTFPSRCRHRL